MTKAEFNGLYDSLCYGHDAELRINGNIVFAEWNGEKIELFHYYDHGFRTAKASFLAELGLVCGAKSPSLRWRKPQNAFERSIFQTYNFRMETST